MNLSEKKTIVEDLHDKLKKSKLVILADYKGLNVKHMTDLRSELRKVDASCKIAKNSLILRASDETDVALLKDFLTGPNALILSYEDPVAPAKVLTDFAQENKALQIKSAVLNGKLINIDEIKSLSMLPSREVLLSQVLSALNGVSTSFVRVLNGVTGNLLNVLNAIKDQKESS